MRDFRDAMYLANALFSEGVFCQFRLSDKCGEELGTDFIAICTLCYCLTLANCNNHADDL